MIESGLAPSARAVRQRASHTFQQRDNKALQPTAYAPVVPPFAMAARELSRCAAARGLNGYKGLGIIDFKENENAITN